MLLRRAGGCDVVRLPSHEVTGYILRGVDLQIHTVRFQVRNNCTVRWVPIWLCLQSTLMLARTLRARRFIKKTPQQERRGAVGKRSCECAKYE